MMVVEGDMVLPVASAESPLVGMRMEVLPLITCMAVQVEEEALTTEAVRAEEPSLSRLTVTER